MQSSPLPCYLIPLGPKYGLPYPVHKLSLPIICTNTEVGLIRNKEVLEDTPYRITSKSFKRLAFGKIIQSVHFIVSTNTETLLYRKPACAGAGYSEYFEALNSRRTGQATHA
jgi:hypothetical protein